MLSKREQLLARLSDEEQVSLRKLCACGCDNDIPGDHAEKLLGLGLAELTCGGLGPSCSGRSAVARLVAS
ncbi:MAG: hypothetical protein AAF334_06870 [Pseudomonadota bacterium]